MLQANCTRAEFRELQADFKAKARVFNSDFPKADNIYFLQKIVRLMIGDSVNPVASAITNPFINSLCLGQLPEPIRYDVRTDTIDFVRLAMSLNALVSKNPSLDAGVDPQEAAIRKYIECENVCRKNNQKLSYRRPCGEWDFPFSFSEFLFRVREFATSILGTAPDVGSIIRTLKFGPGANTTTQTHTSVRYKLSAEPGCGQELRPLLRQYSREFPRWLSNVTFPVTPATLTFVPKNSKTHRPIEVQPLLSGCYQLSVGDIIRGRLFENGVNLRDQSINQERARIGSITDTISTIDLSSASDSICARLVFEVLPPDWLDVLSFGRVSQISYHSKLFTLNKWSAMGNGYTFELESLIFYCVSKVICELTNLPTDITVYGDDITCSDQSTDAVIKALVACGFTINLEKSFTSGPFRESCGSDFIFGYDVRPCFMKSTLSYRQLTRLHNFYKRKCLYPSLVKWLEDYLIDLVPSSNSWHGDGCLHADVPFVGRSDNWRTFEMCFKSRERSSREPLVGDSFWVTSHLDENPIWEPFPYKPIPYSKKVWDAYFSDDYFSEAWKTINEREASWGVRGFNEPYKLVRVLNP